MNAIFIIILIAVIVIMVTNQPCWKNKNENYINMYGEYIDSAFFEDDDRKCRKLCNNVSDCKGYSYDPTTDKCYLNDSKGDYILPYSDHWLYPNYDPYLYKYGWWLQVAYDNPLNDEQIAESNLGVAKYDDAVVNSREKKSDRESINTLRGLQNKDKKRPVIPIDFAAKGYRDTMYMGQNAYHFDTPKNNNYIKYTGNVNNLLGGGHGGRVRGNVPSGNEIVYM
jgi:hypothetical protein